MPVAGAPVTIVGIISTVLVARERCVNTAWDPDWQPLVNNGYMRVYDPPIACTSTSTTLGDSQQSSISAITGLQAALAAKVPIVLDPIRWGAAIATVGVTASDKALGARTLTGASMRTAGAPQGSNLVVEIQHYAGAWNTVGALTIADGFTAEHTISFTQPQAVSNLLRLNVTSVGSTTPATGVAVDVYWGI